MPGPEQEQERSAEKEMEDVLVFEWCSDRTLIF